MEQKGWQETVRVRAPRTVVEWEQVVSLCYGKAVLIPNLPTHNDVRLAFTKAKVLRITASPTSYKIYNKFRSAFVISLSNFYLK